MFGNMPPFFLSVPQVATSTQGGILTTSAQTIAGAKTWNVPGIASAAETLASWKLTGADGDAVAHVDFQNYSATNGVFQPVLYSIVGGTIGGLVIESDITTDTVSGNNSALRFQTRIAAGGAAIVNRTLVDLMNGPNQVLTLIPLNSGANAALSWGTQAVSAPAFTTRPAGIRTVLRAAIDGTHVDDSIGVESGGPYVAIQQANSSWQFSVYAGTTRAAYFRGDGLFATTGGRNRKVRVALTTPVTVAVTDDIIEINLTTPGAVALNLPAGVTGTEYVFQDGKGDAGANNHTFTPAAGTINGAATKVYATNYYRATAYYNGTQWLIG